MAKRKFLVDLDLNQNELLKAKLESLASAPAGPVEGQIYFDTTKDQIGVCTNATGPVWSYGGDITDVVAGTGGISVSVDANGVATVSIDAATGSTPGHMSAADKTKLDNATSSEVVNTLVIRDANGDFEAGKITLNDTPVNDDHAATKGYVDSVAQGLDVKESVRVHDTANVSISSAPATIDGVTLTSGDRVLLSGQTTTTEDGIYIFNGSGSAMTRAADFATGDTVASAFMFVEEGTANADTGWVCTNNSGSDVVGTDDLVFTQFSGAGSIVAGFGLTKTGNTIDVVAGDNSLDVLADSVAVKLNATGGIETTGTGLNVKVDTNHVTKNGSNELTIGNHTSRIGYKAITVGTVAGVQTITHNWGTREVQVVVYDATTYEIYECEIKHATTNTVTIEAKGTNTNVVAVLTGNVGESIA